MADPARSPRPGSPGLLPHEPGERTGPVTPGGASRSDRCAARLVRNLLALRRVLSTDQMQTGKWTDRIEEIDQELAGLGHDMNSTAARASEGLRRTFLLPLLVQRRARVRGRDQE